MVQSRYGNTLKSEKAHIRKGRNLHREKETHTNDYVYLCFVFLLLFGCFFVCVSVSVCQFKRTRAHACVHVFVCLCMRVCVCIYVCVRMCVCMRLSVLFAWFVFVSVRVFLSPVCSDHAMRRLQFDQSRNRLWEIPSYR